MSRAAAARKQADSGGELVVHFIISRIRWRKRRNSALSSFPARTSYGPSHAEGHAHPDPPPTSSPPATTWCWIGPTFLVSNHALHLSSMASLCSPLMPLGFPGIRIFHWEMLVMKNFRVAPLNLTVATLYQLDAAHAGNLLFFWCISDFTFLQMFCFEQFLKLVLTLFFPKEGKCIWLFSFPLWDRTKNFQGVRLD